MKKNRALTYRLVAIAQGLLCVLVLFAACSGPQMAISPPDISTSYTTEATLVPSPTPQPTPFTFDPANPNYREAMRQWVMAIADQARETNPQFIIVPQNASPLLTQSGQPTGQPSLSFIATIDGLGQESLCFGEGGYGVARGEKSRTQITEQLSLAESFGLSVLSIDYCKSTAKVDFTKIYNGQYGFIGFAAESFQLTSVPEFKNETGEAYDVNSLADANSFLIMLNPEGFSKTDDLINTLAATDYDVIIMDPDFNEKAAFNPEQIKALKTKASGGRRLVVAYLSIGEAEDYRHYWQSDWHDNPLDWMGSENPRWDGNYVVQYWREEWQSIVLYAEDSMLNRILELGFDGAYLDLVDAYEMFED